MPIRTFVLDPPWQENGGGRIKRGADRHYETMPVPDIIATVLRCPLWEPHPVGTHVWCWVTNTFLYKGGFRLLDALGATYKTNLVWNKTDEEGNPEGIRLGLGQYGRHQHELCLLGIIGNGYSARKVTARKTRTTFYAPRGDDHSAKPDKAYKIIKQISKGPYAELFARGEATGPRKGWTIWGNEAQSS